jgi:hypothetical protein
MLYVKILHAYTILQHLLFWLANDGPFRKSILHFLLIALPEESWSIVLKFFKHPFKDFKKREHKHQ